MLGKLTGLFLGGPLGIWPVVLLGIGTVTGGAVVVAQHSEFTEPLREFFQGEADRITGSVDGPALRLVSGVAAMDGTRMTELRLVMRAGSQVEVPLAGVGATVIADPIGNRPGWTLASAGPLQYKVLRDADGSLERGVANGSDLIEIRVDLGQAPSHASQDIHVVFGFDRGIPFEIRFPTPRSMGERFIELDAVQMLNPVTPTAPDGFPYVDTRHPEN